MTDARALAGARALGGLGMYHGINPAMGWLFAVALCLHRGCQSVVLQSLIPIAIGHLLSIAVVAGATLALGFVIDRGSLMLGGRIRADPMGAVPFCVWLPSQARIGMLAGFAGLLGWSFLIASAHGAGLMVVPTLVTLCLSGSGIDAAVAAGPVIYSFAAVCVHTQRWSRSAD